MTDKQYKIYILNNLKHIKKYFSDEAISLCIDDYVVLTKKDRLFSMPYFKHIIEQNILNNKIVMINNYFSIKDM